MGQQVVRGMAIAWVAAALAAQAGCGGGDAGPDHGDPPLPTDGSVNPPLDGSTSDSTVDGSVDEEDLCGNGRVDPDEQCDHGGDLQHHACAEDCTLLNPPSGAPIEADDFEWVYVPIEGAVCRDGSDTGIMVNLNSASDKVVMYMEGGGACFNFTTCFINPPSFSGGFSSSSGIFDREHPDNPVADWNFVYIPYCTGDVHAGDTQNEVSIYGLQQFRGYRNVTLALDRIVPTFPHADQVLLTGISAGGFGAAANAEQVQRAFWFAELVLLDDSGPPMGPAAIAPCLQDQWRQLWGFDNTILADCGGNCPNSDDYVLDLAGHLVHRYPDGIGGLFSNTQDGIIRLFYGYGNDDCGGGGVVSEEVFEAGLMDFREYVTERSSTFGTYYLEGSGHTCVGPLTGDLGGECFYDTEVDGVPLTEWVADLLDGVASHVGP
jgi:hypothetical protein